MAWSSTTPDVITELVQRFSAVDGMPTVLDGPVPADDALSEVLTVGYTDEMSFNAAEGDLATNGLAITPDREQYTINSAATVLDGASSVAAARARAYEIVALARQTLAADPRLGGLVMSVRLSSVTLVQSATSQGMVASVIFGVYVDAFTKR